MLIIRLLLIALILALLASLTGCSIGQSQWDSRAMDHTKVAFVGIPTMFGLGFTGTTTPITREYSFTNEHVAYPTLRRISYAPIGQKITLYGYSGRTMLPVSGRGTVKGVGMRKGCMVGWTDAGSVQGMSGGAVINDSGALVGIIFGGDIWNGRTYFIMAPALQEMIKNG